MAIAARVCVVVTLLLAAPGSLLAQSLFIDAAPIFSWDKVGWHKFLNGGLSVGGGLMIGERTEVRVVLEAPSTTTFVASRNVYGGTPPVVVERVTNTIRARSPTASVTIGRYFPVGTRWRLRASAGLLGSRRVNGVVTTTVWDVKTGTMVNVSHPGPRSLEQGRPVFGFGGIVAVTKHLSVAPDTRIIWCRVAGDRGAITRAVLNTRWTF